MHQVVTAQLAHRRAGTQSTKTRAEVSGGGKKPFSQKGTGGARQGSTRAPHYTGGGIALGPRPRKYSQRTPRKMVRLALRSALSDRNLAGRIVVLDSWEMETPSTKSAVTALRAIGIEGKVLVVLTPQDDAVAKVCATLSMYKSLASPNSMPTTCSVTTGLFSPKQACRWPRKATNERSTRHHSCAGCL